MSAHPNAAITPCVTTKCHTFVLKEDRTKLIHVSAAPQRAAAGRLRAHRLANGANRKGMERYMTPLVVVPMIPVISRDPCSVQLLYKYSWKTP